MRVVAAFLFSVAGATWIVGVVLLATGSQTVGAVVMVVGGLLMLRVAAAYRRVQAGGQSESLMSALRSGFPGFWP